MYFAMLTSTCLKELVVLYNRAWPGVLGIWVFWVFFILAYGILFSQYGYKVSCFPEFLVFAIQTRVTVFTILRYIGIPWGKYRVLYQYQITPTPPLKGLNNVFISLITKKKN